MRINYPGHSRRHQQKIAKAIAVATDFNAGFAIKDIAKRNKIKNPKYIYELLKVVAE